MRQHRQHSTIIYHTLELQTSDGLKWVSSSLLLRNGPHQTQTEAGDRVWCGSLQSPDRQTSLGVPDRAAGNQTLIWRQAVQGQYWRHQARACRAITQNGTRIGISAERTPWAKEICRCSDGNNGNMETHHNKSEEALWGQSSLCQCFIMMCLLFNAEIILDKG